MKKIIFIFSCFFNYGLYSQSIINIGNLPSGTSSRPTGISADGNVVIGFSDITNLGTYALDNPTHAFRWDSGSGIVDLGTLSGTYLSIPTGLSGDGSVIVGSSGFINDESACINQAFVWHLDTGMQKINGIESQELSEAYGISRDGLRINGKAGSLSEGVNGFMYSYISGVSLTPRAYLKVNNTGSVTIDSSKRFKANDEYEVIGGFSNEGGNNKYWDILNMSEDGKYVVGGGKKVWSLEGSTNAVAYYGKGFIWSEDNGFESLGTLPGDLWSEATAISDDGQIIIGNSGNDTSSRAFIWTPNEGMVELKSYLTSYGIDTSYWQITSADALSADGQKIAGTYQSINILNEQGSFLAILPEPSALSLLAVGLGGLAILRRRRS